MMLGTMGMLSIFVFIRTCSYYAYYYGTTPSEAYNAHASIAAIGNAGGAATVMRNQSSIQSLTGESWMDEIASCRKKLADVSHELKREAHGRSAKSKNKANTEKATRHEKSKNEPLIHKKEATKDSSSDRDDQMIDLSVLYDAVVDTIERVGVRGLLFEVLSDDFEYYVYNDESTSYDEDENDDNSDNDYESLDEIEVYWKHCASKHGVGRGCNEWDVWWTYHYVGAIITDVLLQDNGLLWDGSSGERIATPPPPKTTTTTAGSNNVDAAMAELLDKIHQLQASLPYVTQSSFHAQHALIWRYVEKSSERLLSLSSSSSLSSLTYPWELAKLFCRGDGSRQKGIVGRPVGKGVDHECFHGFGHAVFYAVASKQLESSGEQQSPHDNSESTKRDSNDEGFLVLRPHGGFVLAPESYCEVHALCQGASPPKNKRSEMDPNNEASGNSYRICFEGVVHSVRLLSEDSPNTNNKGTAIDVVDQEMKRCATLAKKKKKEKDRKGKNAKTTKSFDYHAGRHRT